MAEGATASTKLVSMSSLLTLFSCFTPCYSGFIFAEKASCIIGVPGIQQVVSGSQKTRSLGLYEEKSLPTVR